MSIRKMKLKDYGFTPGRAAELKEMVKDKQYYSLVSICAHVPVAWIRISPPKQYTEEQRQQMGERMRRNVSENKGVQE